METERYVVRLLAGKWCVFRGDAVAPLATCERRLDALSKACGLASRSGALFDLIEEPAESAQTDGNPSSPRTSPHSGGRSRLARS